MLERIPLNYYVLAGLINFISSFTLGCYVLLKNVGERINQRFFFFAFTVAGWGLFYFLWLNADQSSLAEFYLRTLMLFVVFIPTTFTHFILVFLKIDVDKKINIFNYFISFFIGAAVYTQFFAKDVSQFFVFPYWLKINYIFHLHSIHFFANIIYSHSLMLKKIRNSAGILKNQIIYVLIGTSIGYLAGAFNYLTWYRIPVPPFLNPLVSVYVLMVAIAIVRFDVMDIGIAVKEVTAHIISTLLISSIFIIIGLNFFSKPVFVAAIFISTIISALIYGPIRLFLRPIILGTKFEYTETISDYSKELVSILNIDTLIDKTIEIIVSSMRLNKAIIIIYDEQEKIYKVRGAHGIEDDKINAIKFNENIVLVDFLKKKRLPFLKEEIEQSSILNKKQILLAMDNLFVQVCIPIIIKDNLLGSINLGKKNTKEIYTKEDLNLLTTLTNQFAIALENAQAYSELNEYKIGLEDKVKEKTKELEKTNTKLAEANKNKDIFLANISHELRTPLTLTLAPIESMVQKNMGNFNEEEYEQIIIAHENALILLRQINDLLDLTRLQDGKMVLKIKANNIKELLFTIIARVGNMANKKGIELVFNHTGDLANIYFDYDKMEKVFINLISNALKFTDKGGKIEVFAKADIDKVVINVSDTGQGILEDKLDAVFERFVQVDGTSTRSYGGSGIGLSLVKDFVELHKGKVSVSSKIGEGSIFTIEILKGKKHIKKEFLTESTEDDRELEELRYSSIVEKSDILNTDEGIKIFENELNKDKKQDRLKILIVEDNPDMYSLVGKTLCNDYEIHIAGDGEQGLSKARIINPDLIISDVMMPKKDGIEMMQEIRQDKTIFKIPIIMLTAKTELEHKIKGIEEGANDYIPKPFNRRELEVRVKSLLVQRKYEKELEIAYHNLEEMQAELVHKGKLAMAGEISASVAHEVNSYTSAIFGWRDKFSRVIEKMKKSDIEKEEGLISLSNTMQKIENLVKKINHIVESLLGFSRKNKEGFNEVNIHEGIDAVLTLFDLQIMEKINIHKKYDENIQLVYCNLEDLNHVFMNMINNANHAICEKYKDDKKGNLWIETKQEHDKIDIIFRDDGIGVNEEIKNKLFDSFFTTKIEGTGLGLSICRKIINKHKGNIFLNINYKQGAEFIISLPRKEQ